MITGQELLCHSSLSFFPLHYFISFLNIDALCHKINKQTKFSPTYTWTPLSLNSIIHTSDVHKYILLQTNVGNSGQHLVGTIAISFYKLQQET